MKKTINKIIFLVLILSFYYIPSFAIKVNAIDIDMSKTYKIYIYYADGKVAYGSYDTYAQAKEAMNNYPSSANETAAILYNDIVINADYAIVHNDDPAQKGRVNADNIFKIYSNASDANKETNSLSYIAGTWGVDGAFLDYDDTYKAYKIKISGITGWVNMNQISVVPIASYYGYSYKYQNNSAKIKVNIANIKVKKEPSLNSELLCSDCITKQNSIYTYYPSKTIKTTEDTWYFINYNGTKGYISSNEQGAFSIVNTLLTDTFYFANNNILYHHIHKGLKYYDINQVLGTAPFYYPSQSTRKYYLDGNNLSYVGTLESATPVNTITKRYLSFDGNYFYTDFSNMIDDYRKGTYDKAINYENPYYSYFMYLPSRAKTGYDANTIDQTLIRAGINSSLKHEPNYYYNSDGSINNPIGSESVLYGMGSTIINIANKYGVNPMSIYTSASRESANGTSSIAVLKNNLFGYGASDSNPFANAVTYNSIEASIDAYAQTIGGNSAYTNISYAYYHGTHKGNKLSGTNVYYMSDPYGGESDTTNLYNIDLANGQVDNYANTIGIKNNNQVISVYAEPSNNSRTIYLTKNYATGKILENIPFIVADKVYTYENGKNQGYYKVYTDVSLNSDRVLDATAIYNFDNCYGYIKEEFLYVLNKQPVINASNIEITQFDELNLKKGVTAIDHEDGDLTSSIIVNGEVNNQVPGVYNVSYTVTDKNRYSVTKKITVTVNQTLSPIIVADDVEVSQYTAFDPKSGVSVSDATDGNITNKISIVSNPVDTTKLGTYNVIYRVTNSLNKSTEKTRIVNVIYNQKPIINATNKTLYLGDSFNALTSVTATDKEDGDLTDKIVFSGDVNTQKVGQYNILYSVKDSLEQTTSKTISITVLAKQYISKDSIFHLEKLLYNEKTKKVDFTGFLIIKGMNNTLKDDISYSLIFKNQYNEKTIVKSLERLTNNTPFNAPNDGNFVNDGAWFNQSLDLSDIETGNYSVYVRARLGDYETIVSLKNPFFNPNVSSKFKIDNNGYQFKTNYYGKNLPIELIVRQNGLIAEINNPTIDNMYNQLYSISIKDNYLNIKASSHNVNGDYGINADVKRFLMFENIETNKDYLVTDVGSITDVPYMIKLKVDDGFDKTRAWYNTKIDISSLPKGKYAIIVRTTTKNIDDYGELYDIISANLDLSGIVGGNKVTITRNKDLRYRIELTIE